MQVEAQEGAGQRGPGGGGPHVTEGHAGTGKRLACALAVSPSRDAVAGAASSDGRVHLREEKVFVQLGVKEERDSRS
ncbi:hypothetical protein U9M48_001628 [Paspalum notatum var. saurae]|uniref:Uncharacterized protein n=1 Tax=Paspalum notatum var. saurae TaxID=547442 RepID=A0AAQ3SIG3_PASNO